jgi:hypothetical protein
MVCTEPLTIAADAVIIYGISMGRRMACVGFAG